MVTEKVEEREYKTKLVHIIVHKKQKSLKQWMSENKQASGRDLGKDNNKKVMTKKVKTSIWVE